MARSDSFWERLVDDRLLTSEEANTAKARHAELGGAPDTAVLEVMPMAPADRGRLLDLLARLHEMSPAPAATLEQPAAEALALCPKDIAERHALLAVRLTASTLTVAGPKVESGVISRLAFSTGRRVEHLVALEMETRLAMLRHLGLPLSLRFEQLRGAQTRRPRNTAAMLRFRSLSAQEPTPAPTPGPSNALSGPDWTRHTVDTLRAIDAVADIPTALANLQIEALEGHLFFLRMAEGVRFIAGALPTPDVDPADLTPELGRLSVLRRALSLGTHYLGAPDDRALTALYAAEGREMPAQVMVEPILGGHRILGIFIGDGGPHPLASSAVRELRRALAAVGPLFRMLSDADVPPPPALRLRPPLPPLEPTPPPIAMTPTPERAIPATPTPLADPFEGLLDEVFGETSIEVSAHPAPAPPEPTQAPPEPTQAPPEPTQAPPEPTQAPPEPTQAPPESTPAPPESTAVVVPAIQARHATTAPLLKLSADADLPPTRAPSTRAIPGTPNRRSRVVTITPPDDDLEMPLIKAYAPRPNTIDMEFGGKIPALTLRQAVAALTDATAEVREAAEAQLLAAGHDSLNALLSAFPGEVVIDRYGGTVGEFPVEEHSAVLRIICQLGPSAAQAFERLFEHLSPEVRYYAVYCFSAVVSPASVLVMTSRLFDGDASVRAITAYVIGLYRGDQVFRDVIGQLRRVLSAGRPRRKLMAAEMLGTLRSFLAIPDLLHTLETAPQRHLSEAARRALVETTRHDLGTDPKKWRAWLARHGEAPRVVWLLAGLESRHRAIRTGSVQELRALSGQQYRYEIDGAPSQRQAAITRWQQWWGTVGQHHLGDYR